MTKNSIFYFVKPIIPRTIQLHLRRKRALNILKKSKDLWPIDINAALKPEKWSNWPNGKQFTLVLMHDVDTQIGHDNCLNLMELEKDLGFRSTFYFVPERYTVSEEVLNKLKKNGFGIGVHGLKHDGKLFKNKKIFQKRAAYINNYFKKWKTTGFSSPSMHHKLDWMHELECEYATTTFDTDPFEPQPEGVSTIFPFIVKGGENERKKYVELPYTLVQDFTLFVIMQEKDSSVWEKKIHWVAQNNGMALINTHPDYMRFGNDTPGNENYPFTIYRNFLKYIADKFSGRYWHVLSREVASFWESEVVKG